MRALVLLALVGTAAADERPAPRPLQIAATLDGDTAKFAVRYLVHATVGDTELPPAYPLPHHGLVTSAVVTEGGKRHPLALVTAAQARTDLDALLAKPPARQRTRAAVISVDEFRQGELAIDFVAPRGSTIVADVEITAPTCYHRDARYVAVPAGWVPRLPPAMHVRETAEICNTLDDGQAWVKFPASALAARAGGADRVGTYAHRTRVGSTSFVKLELNLAAKLSEVPADLATVIVVDGSRSMTREELEAQRATVAAYLRAAPNGRVQVIAYARRAQALLPGWMATPLAAPRVARALGALQRTNGSNVSTGLREAGKWLAQVQGTRRIVLFTDERLPALEAQTRAIDDALPPSTLVHVVALGGAGLVRDDDALLARIAKETRGVSVRGGELEQQDERTLPLDATVLARPITLDHVRIRTPGWTSLGVAGACPEDEPLAEGEGCTWWGRGDAVATPFVVEGLLWNEPVERALRADLGRSLEVVRELSMMRVLGAELQPLAERAARAVNAVWSLYTTWGGDGGYADAGGVGGFGYSSMCGGCNSSDIGHGFGTGTISQLSDLAPALTRIAHACPVDARLALEVETTFEEIVGVDVDGGTPALRTCVEEALWNAWLVAPRAPAHTVTRFVVEPY